MKRQLTIGDDADERASDQEVETQQVQQGRADLASIDVLTQRYDNARSGANLQETTLSPATFDTPGRFRKQFEIAVDGHVYAQPLYVPGLTFPKHGRRNALYVATMRNQVAAWDADREARTPADALWVTSLGPYVKLPDPNIGPYPHYYDIADAIGVVSTPVISLDPNLRAIYVVAMTHEKTAEGEDRYYHRLHALDLLDGGEKFKPGGVVIQGSVPGDGDGSQAGMIRFTSNRQNQRPGLLLANGTIYVAFASYGDKDPYHGWVFGFDARTLEQRPNIYNNTRYGEQGGIWMAGQGPAADAAGNVYAISGNGTFAQTVIADKVTPKGVTANGHPALAVTPAELVVAWRGRDPGGHLNVVKSSGGSVWGRIATLADTTLDGPALAYGNGRLYLAWTGNGNGQLNVMQSVDGVSWVNKVTLTRETSSSGPALVFAHGRLYLSWTGGDRSLNILQSRDGVNWEKKVILRETSQSTSPGLAFDGTTLFLLWAGGPDVFNKMLNIAELDSDGHLVKKAILTETSDNHPALARHGRDGLHLVWRGRDVAGSLNHMFGAAPDTLGGKDTYGDRSLAAPALAVFRDRLLICWTGTDGRVNVAEVADIPQLGDAFVKLSPDLRLADWFTPWNTRELNRDDEDLGSGGALILPDAGLIVGGGKEGKLYVLDPSHLGHFCDTCRDPDGDKQIVQWWQATGIPNNNQPPPPPAAHGHHIHGAPVYWRSAARGPRIFVWGEADWLRAFKFDGTRFITTPDDISKVTTPARSMPGGMLTISADGDKDATGIIWASHPIDRNANQAVVPGLVRAIRADDLGQELWNSTWNDHDRLGNCAKFTAPTVVDGKVYVATFSGKICVYAPTPRA